MKASDSSNSNASSPFQVFRIFPSNWNDVKSLAKLRKLAEESGESEIDFWLDSRHPGQFADVMVSPRALPHFQKFMASQNLNHTVTIRDVEKLIYLNEFEPEILRNSNKQQERPPTMNDLNNLTPNSKSRDESDLELQSFMRRLRDDGGGGGKAQ
uniref:Carboxypeptidase activation peptide domain-containing protein n=1 Tax=Ditylenchus dipsaci TaxID=166011 RepID=A0A915E5M5_9BILA